MPAHIWPAKTISGIVSGSKLISNTASGEIKKLAKEGLADDDEGYKAEFIRLIEGSKAIAKL